MFTILFLIIMFGVFGNILGFAIKASWGLFKIIMTVFFLPLVLLIMVFSGLIAVAFPILIVVGIVVCVKKVLL